MKAVSPSMEINMKGPSHYFDVVRNTSTGEPAGSFLSTSDRSFSHGRELCLRLNYSLLFAFSLLDYSLSSSISCARCICVFGDIVLAGIGNVPYTSSIMHRPSHLCSFYRNDESYAE